jgi:hypothetical protein
MLALIVVMAVACAKGSETDTGDEDDGSGAAGATGGSAGNGGTGGTAGNGGTAASGGGGKAGMGGEGANGGGGTGGAGPPTVWINEIHYDNDGTDTGEGIEVAGTAGIALSQYRLELYSAGTLYQTVMLSGTLNDQENGYGALFTPILNLQNGPSDGVALVAVPTTEVVLFLSWEGTFTAVDGTAMGMTSVDIGVSEQTTTPAGQSVQLTGTGNSYGEFTWTGPLTSSSGGKNAGQTFSN